MAKFVRSEGQIKIKPATYYSRASVKRRKYRRIGYKFRHTLWVNPTVWVEVVRIVTPQCGTPLGQKRKGYNGRFSRHV
jgi:hypothetical protein